MMADKSCQLAASHGIFSGGCCYLSPHVSEVVKIFKIRLINDAGAGVRGSLGFNWVQPRLDKS